MIGRNQAAQRNVRRVLNVAHLKTQTMSFSENLVGSVRKNEQPDTTHSNDPPSLFRIGFSSTQKHPPKVQLLAI